MYDILCRGGQKEFLHPIQPAKIPKRRLHEGPLKYPGVQNIPAGGDGLLEELNMELNADPVHFISCLGSVLREAFLDPFTVSGGFHAFRASRTLLRLELSCWSY